MRILNNDTDSAISNITIYFKKHEAKELLDSLGSLLENSKGNHAHIPSYEDDKEISICIYDENDIDEKFDARIKDLRLNRIWCGEKQMFFRKDLKKYS